MRYRISRITIILIVAMLSLVVPVLPASANEDTYDRIMAILNARENHENWLPPNFPQDCAWYVSQALWAGGLPQTQDWSWYTEDRSMAASDIWFPGPTRVATVADELIRYLENQGWAVVRPITWSDNTAEGARLGDIIAYDWNGDQEIDHVAIVTALNEQGYPWVSQQTPAQWNRFWSWSVEEDTHIEFVEAYDNPRAYLVHITY